jgi:hypothetical protein
LDPLILTVAAFTRPDDATHAECGIHKVNQSIGPPETVLHRLAGNGFRPYKEGKPPQVHRVFVYIVFFDSLLSPNQHDVVTGGRANGCNFHFTHDERNVQ